MTFDPSFRGCPSSWSFTRIRILAKLPWPSLGVYEFASGNCRYPAEVAIQLIDIQALRTERIRFAGTLVNCTVKPSSLVKLGRAMPGP